MEETNEVRPSGKRLNVITFKVDDELNRLLTLVVEQGHNRSEFIRAAVICALDKICPHCNGTGRA